MQTQRLSYDQPWPIPGVRDTWADEARLRIELILNRTDDGGNHGND
jgi:hypothetical protein